MPRRDGNTPRLTRAAKRRNRRRILARIARAEQTADIRQGRRRKRTTMTEADR